MADNREKRTIGLPSENVPILAEADVVVIGGGTAGFIAATAAARAGAKTILLERFGYLGGCMTTSYNTSIGLFFDSDGNKIIGGLGWEFVERMEEAGQAFEMNHHSPQIWPPYTKKIALDMVEKAGVELYFYAWTSGLVIEDGLIKGVVVQTKGGRSVILGKTFVDASGDADLAAWAGAPWEMTDVDDLQQVSCDYIACGVDHKKVYEWALANRDKLQDVTDKYGMKEAGAQPMFRFTIPGADTSDGYHVGVMPTVKLMIYREAVRLQGNVEIDPLDPKALTYAETQGLKGALEHLEYLKSNVPGFENTFLMTQTHLGVRETRRIVGDYYLTLDDLHGQARFDDVVALNCRALDYHLKGTVFKISYLKGHHDIPLRSLLPKNVENLLVAGRSISGDHLSQASLRGAATCMATGHAAGAAAAVAAKSGNPKIRENDVAAIQQVLLEQKAILATGARGEKLRQTVREVKKV